MPQVSPVNGRFPRCAQPRCVQPRGARKDWSTLSLLFPGKLSLDEGGSDTESLYEIEGLNKIIQFV